MLWLVYAIALFLVSHTFALQKPDEGIVIRLPTIWEPLLKRWDQPFDLDHRKQLAAQAADMFSHAYSSYMKYGYPSDNVKPKSCKPEDVQGGVAVTLLDSLDALLIFNKTDDFRTAARLVEDIRFNSSGEVHVFELTIRAVGGLLSAHVATTSQTGLVPGYAGAFLTCARALADRLLPAFDTPTGIPLSWVSLTRGRLPHTARHTCLSCATTMSLEFRLLSHLTGDRRYGAAVDAAVAAVYSLRHPSTGLLGNTLSTDSGRWDRVDAGVGPGADSFYEYLLKTYLAFGDEAYLRRFAEQYVRVQRYMAVPGTWKGAAWMLDVNMGTLEALKQWVSSLSAFWPGVQASVGQVDAAESLMTEYVRAMLRYGWLPEQIPYHLDAVHPTEVAYPLRPEVIESAYLLWSATGAPRHLRVAEGALGVLNRFSRCDCGYCAIRNISSGELDDSMESFFLAETTKYLFLLLSNATALNDFFVFSTEGHLLPVLPDAPQPPVAAVPELILEPERPAEWRHAAAGGAAAATAALGAGEGGGKSAGAGAEGGGGDTSGGVEDVEAVCQGMCVEKTLEELLQEGQAARAHFPALTFDPEAAQLLRRRRCRACRVVQEHLTALPPLPPCDAARRLGVPLDRPCPAPRHDTPEEAGAKFTAAVRGIEKLQAQMMETVAALRRSDGGADASATVGGTQRCAAPAAASAAAPGPGAAQSSGPPGVGGGIAAAGSMQRAEGGPWPEPTSSGKAPESAPAIEPLMLGQREQVSPDSTTVEDDGAGTCAAAGVAAGEGGLASSGSGGTVAYAMCLLQPMVTPEGMLRCSHTAVLSAAGLPVNILPALLPGRVMVAEAVLDRRAARRNAAAVTVAVAPPAGCVDWWRGWRQLAVLRAAGAIFGPELSPARERSVGGTGGGAGVLRGSQFREALSAASGGSPCTQVRAWARGAGGGDAPAGCCAAASAGGAAGCGGSGCGRDGSVCGRLVVAAPADLCGPMVTDGGADGMGGGGGDYRDAIVLVERGGCMFLEKVMHAQDGGARGVIVVNAPTASGSHNSGADTCGGAGGKAAGPESDTDIFLMDGPGDTGDDPPRDSFIPAAMISHADGRALIAALGCMHGDDACVLCSAGGGGRARPECARPELVAELTGGRVADGVRGGDGGGADGGQGELVASFEVSWKLLMHGGLASDIQQLQEELGIGGGSGWDHAVSAFSQHLSPLIDGWLQEHPEITV